MRATGEARRGREQVVDKGEERKGRVENLQTITKYHVVPTNTLDRRISSAAIEV